MIKRSLSMLFICLLGCLLLPGCEEKQAKVETGTLKKFRFSPGYSDMNGGYHADTLEKDDSGNWVIKSNNRESLDEPEIVTTYEVSPEAVSEFEAFLKDKNIPAFVDKKESNDFMTDYSPWGYLIIYDNSSIGGGKHETYSFGQYKEYSDKDRKVLDELDSRFQSLKGSIISETVEEDP